MARIRIECSEGDKKGILDTFEYNCPFNPTTKECGEDVYCSECFDKNIEFVIKEEEE